MLHLLSKREARRDLIFLMREAQGAMRDFFLNIEPRLAVIRSNFEHRASRH